VEGGKGERDGLPRTLKIGELLLKQNILTESQLVEALTEQDQTREKLGKIVVNRGWATEEEVVRAYSYQTEMPFVYIENETVADIILAEFAREVVEAELFLPLLPAINDGLNAPFRVAIADPWNIKAIDLVRSIAPGRVIPVLATENALREEIKKTYAKGMVQQHLTQRSMVRTLRDLDTTADMRTNHSSGDVDLDEEMGDDDQAPVIRFINTVIADGVRRRASDIHIEPYKRDFQVRYRIDGDLTIAHTLPMSSYAALSSRIKIMSDLDIAERRVPQDGRIAITIDGRSIQLRVSTLPNQYGERVVLRILDSAKAELGMEQLEFSPGNATAFGKLIKNPYGIIMVTGPTGSGKTTTLYAALNALKSSDTNLMTCEDPIEYEIDRISQSNINPKAGLTFAAQLRAILRQDPDVVLVGEIRDAETAEIAMRAAMTGHLVLSTLHCNEAAGAPSRLIDMGVAPFLISSAIVGTVAQRLVKRICPHCRVQVPITDEQRHMVESITQGNPIPIDFVYNAPGCEKCNNSGTAGRMGVHEVMTVNEEIQRLAMQNAATSQVRDAAIRNGMVTMAQDGILKVRDGKTTLVDVMKKVMLD
jgi:type IV pilus assembly protein PilB